MRVEALLVRLKRPEAILWGGFVAIAAAIVTNAVYLQPGPHPAPIFGGREQATAGPSAVSDDLVRRIQVELKEAGYYAGPVDGVAGAQTEAAVAAFERAAGRAVTGRTDERLLDALELAAIAGAEEGSTANSSTESVAWDTAEVAAVQRALSRAAYGQLKADGVFGPQTREAIMRFQSDRGVPVTGEIDDALMVELAAAGALDTD